MQDRSQLLYLQRFRATATTSLRVDAGALTLRVAFSHVPFWQTAADAVSRLGGGDGAGALGDGHLGSPVAEVTPGSVAATPGAGSSGGKLAGSPFRPSSLQITAAVQVSAPWLVGLRATRAACLVWQAAVLAAFAAWHAASLL